MRPLLYRIAGQSEIKEDAFLKKIKRKNTRMAEMVQNVIP